MAERAVEIGDRIIIAAALASTLGPTRQLIQEVADQLGHEISISEVLCAGAWPYFEHGDHEGYFAAIAACLHEAELDGDVIGYTYAGVEGWDYMALRGPAGVLYDIVVDPARRSQGVGRQLLEATLALLAERGAPRVVLSTAEQNEPAQRLFASAGFRRTMIEMTRELDG